MILARPLVGGCPGSTLSPIPFAGQDTAAVRLSRFIQPADASVLAGHRQRSGIDSLRRPIRAVPPSLVGRVARVAPSARPRVWSLNVTAWTWRRSPGPAPVRAFSEVCRLGLWRREGRITFAVARGELQRTPRDLLAVPVSSFRDPRGRHRRPRGGHLIRLFVALRSVGYHEVPPDTALSRAREDRRG